MIESQKIPKNTRNNLPESR